ncbi:hybrid sensor histidine kinase/response regulator [Vibrio panuliri]|uniref:histidine kinase n=1 Tax=Vibrio panuliri TaxID=1381081 RepID=A0A1Q9HIW9_9VIBR|nr:ATP-binding protein [Vibrio panuliri]OLQ90267.1 hybrid sensor histidine kinase/response regulator [Vibrio panuliri]
MTSSALERKIAREKAARKQAETLLEQKSLELYEANQQLKLVLDQLESQNLKGLQKLELEGYISASLIHFGRSFLSRTLDDGLLSSFIERIRACSLVASATLRLQTNLIPSVLSVQFGNPFNNDSDDWVVNTTWSDSTLCLPIKVESGVVGEFRVQVFTSDIEANFIQSQIELVVELICSAISRQLMVTKTLIARKRAEESERATKEFVAMINHELRTPLNGLLGSAELLADTKLNPEQRSMLTNLTHSGDLLRHIINDLLDFSKISAGMMELFPSQFSWDELKNMLNGIFMPQAQEKQIAFLIEEEMPFPQGFVGDFERISQILANLIGNAIKFTSAGKVEVLASWNGHELSIRVKDTGCGIAPQAQQRLFDPFVQADRTAKRNYEGTGLGLAICKNLVELMSGTIDLTSEVGEGSVFSICLPLEAVQTISLVEHADPELSKPLESLSILVVDDIRMNQIIIKQMLKKLSIIPDTGVNGLEAIEAAQTTEYDLIFMDCRMPEMDGFEATRHLRKHDYQKPIIALTAGTTLEEREQCIASGMDDILTKPYTANDLKSMIEKWV